MHHNMNTGVFCLGKTCFLRLSHIIYIYTYVLVVAIYYYVAIASKFMIRAAVT